MEQNTIAFKRDAWREARKRAKKLGKVAEAFIDLRENGFDRSAWNYLYDSLARPLLRKPETFQRLEQFYTPELSKIFRELTDADYEASNACYKKIGYVLRGKLCSIG